MMLARRLTAPTTVVLVAASVLGLQLVTGQLDWGFLGLFSGLAVGTTSVAVIVGAPLSDDERSGAGIEVHDTPLAGGS
jgi:hypothetical protein